VRLRVRSQQDTLAGLLFLALAVGGLWVAQDYPLGTAVRMSAGYVPRLLCMLLALLGAFILASGLTIDGTPIGRVRLRPVLLIPAAVIAFALTIQTLGLVAATLLITLLGSYATPRARLGEILITAAVLALLTVAIFIWGIGLLIPIWPEF
jgi:putative tricarboxylic transport membrane protein